MPLDTKLFIVNGFYPAIRETLLAKGWVENVLPAGTEPTMAFHFLYTVKPKPIFRLPVAPSQFINRNDDTRGLTSKVGLSHNLKRLVFDHGRNVDSFFP